MENNKKTKINLSLIITVLLLVAVLLAVNVAATFIPEGALEIDMSANNIYAVSDISKSFLSDLDQKVTIAVLNADGTNKAFENFVNKYAKYSDMIEITYDTDANASAYSLRIESELRSELLDASSLVYYDNPGYFGKISVSDYQYYVQQCSASEQYAQLLNELLYNTKLYFAGDQMIITCIEYVSADKIPTPYLVTGHGENSVTEGNLSYIFNYFGISVGVYDVTAGDIPADASSLIINEPSEDYSAEEAQKITDYLKAGGSVLLVTSDKNLEMKNLMSIAEYYGVSAYEGLVAQIPPVEESADESQTDSEPEAEEEDVTDIEAEDAAEGGETSEDAAEEVNIHEFEVNINTEHDSLVNFEGYSAVAINANAIKISDTLRQSVLVTKLLTTSDKAYIGTEDNTGTYTIGVLVEEALGDETSEFIWYTGADAFNKEAALQGTNPVLLIYGMAWISESFESEVGVISPVEYTTDVIEISKTAKNIGGAIMIAVIPVTVLLAGSAIYTKRRKSAKKA